MASALSDLEIQRALGQLPGWARRGGALTKSYRVRTFRAAADLVMRIAEVAERRAHYPDVDVRGTTVTCTLTTPAAGGVTQDDLDLAGAIESVAAQSQAGK
jgi:4a-hydroxytetrahydrobiopterin dehydratase